jgi:vacuolar-type H+-ATPase subunit D/Vma8
MAIRENKLELSNAMNKIKTIVIADLYLAQLKQDMNNFIIKIDKSDHRINTTLQQIYPNTNLE